MIENSLIIGYNIVTVNIMEIAISTATFFGKSYTEDSLDLIKSLGLKTVEVFLTTFREYEPVFGDLLASRKGDLNVHSVHSLNLHYEPELFNNAERTREDAEAILNKVMSNGAKLGAKYYTFHGIARLKKRPYVVDYDVFARKGAARGARVRSTGFSGRRPVRTSPAKKECRAERLRWMERGESPDCARATK